MKTNDLKGPNDFLDVRCDLGGGNISGHQRFLFKNRIRYKNPKFTNDR